jgi:hypothetical protein
MFRVLWMIAVCSVDVPLVKRKIGTYREFYPPRKSNQPQAGERFAGAGSIVPSRRLRWNLIGKSIQARKFLG